MLGGCLGAEPGEETLEVQADHEFVRTAAADLVLEESATSSPKWATFDGQSIDLSNGWGEARVCLVLDEDLVECFRTNAEADAWIAEIGSDKNDMIASSRDDDTISALHCGDYLLICAPVGHVEPCLRFYRRQFTYNLPAFGFNDRMSSFIVGSCGATFYEHINRNINGGASFYGKPRASSRNVGAGWNDRISSIWIY
jgi:hypothetical protein